MQDGMLWYLKTFYLLLLNGLFVQPEILVKPVFLRQNVEVFGY